MKIKIPKFKTIFLTEYDYFVREDGKVLLTDKGMNRIVKNGDEPIELPNKYHVQLLMRETEIRVYPKGKLFILK
jgi:hypothetical protein